MPLKDGSFGFIPRLFGKRSPADSLPVPSRGTVNNLFPMAHSDPPSLFGVLLNHQGACPLASFSDFSFFNFGDILVYLIHRRHFPMHRAPAN